MRDDTEQVNEFLNMIGLGIANLSPRILTLTESYNREKQDNLILRKELHIRSKRIDELQEEIETLKEQIEVLKPEPINQQLIAENADMKERLSKVGDLVGKYRSMF